MAVKYGYIREPTGYFSIYRVEGGIPGLSSPTYTTAGHAVFEEDVKKFFPAAERVDSLSFTPAPPADSV